MTKVSEEVINNLVAKKIFEDLTSKYCRGLDRIDEGLLKGVFWKEAEVDIGIFSGSIEDFMPFIIETLNSSIRGSHSVSNFLFEIDNNFAVGEIYVHGVSSFFNEENIEIDGHVGGRYLTQYEKREEEWRMTKLTYIMDWNMNIESSALWNQGFRIGVRGEGDLSHSSLKSR